MKKIYYLTLIIFLASFAIHAQETEKPKKIKRAVLNGHYIQSLSYIRPSFITTNLSANIGFGSTPALKIQGIKIEDIEIVAFEGRVLFVDVAVQYQQRFTPWLSMYLVGNMAGRLGTDLSTLVVDGVSTLSGFKVGWLVRVYHNDKFNLAANIHAANVTGSFINLSQYIEDLINNVPNASLKKKVPVMVIDIGVSGAYAFNPTYAIQFFGDFAYGESFERGRSQGYYSFGFSGEMDFNPKHNVPFGLALGYVATTDPESISADSGFSNIFMGKLGYSGSDDFELGVQFSYYSVNLRSVDKKPYVSKIMLMLKFFF